MDFSQIQINADETKTDTATASATTHDVIHSDDEVTEQAKVAAFIADDDDEEEQHTDTSKNSTSNKKRILNKLGHFFKNKNKKAKKKNKKNSTDDSVSVDADNNNNNNNNSNADLEHEHADIHAMFHTQTVPADADADAEQHTNCNMNEQVIMDKVGGDLPWNCEKCTFLNEATELHCTVCFYARFEVKNLPAQWQWKAADRWITYGIPETIEIEEAYKSGAKEVVLTKGWFSSNPSMYRIIFDKQHGSNLAKHKKNKRKSGQNDDQHHEFDENATHFYQINKDTGTRREVRRIGTDDDNLFRKLTLDMLDESDRKCMICLSPFTQEEESDGIIVQLSTCKGHGFHKECIAQWVQLKGNCPLCRIDVETL
mmetsp:Transcript_17104/g.26657  ORF Transcript_17104/g.26657 Transcript_17104/m.26657 type:complete len:370 (-) Transcript_17104:97-1206(-)